jgi:phosphohistidine phosphatase SixA
MVIFLLRHADRSSTGDDALSPAGRARAERLAHMLVETGVSMALCSDAQRTQETLAPLKLVRGDGLVIKPVSTQAPGGLAEHVNATVAAIEALPAGAVVMVVGHSNTIGPIIERLGGGSIAPIGETEFDKLFLLCRPAGSSNAALQMRY